MFKFFSDSFENFKKKVSNTASALVGNVVEAAGDEENFSEFVLDDMEDVLIGADLGVNYAAELVDRLIFQRDMLSTISANSPKDFFQRMDGFIEPIQKTGFLKFLKGPGYYEKKLLKV